jgi:5-methylcytosine-specific restriction endonuclease McrA
MPIPLLADTYTVNDGSCLVCGALLIGKRRDAVYCSRTCKGQGPTFREYQRRWVKENAERRKAYEQRWYLANRDEVNERARKWAEANPEKAREAQRAWRKRNPEKHRANVKRSRLKNRDGFNMTRNARMRTPKGRAERVEASQRRYARILGNEYEAITSSAWETKLAEYQGCCAYCGNVATQRDHVVPLARGGSHTLDNLVPVCGPCNRFKGDKLLSEWEAV